jgi:GT2 family glycosyltransferase
MTVWVVVAVFNRRAYTEKCLEQLQSQSVDDMKIVVVDDGSSDGTAEAIKEKFPDIILLEGDGSLYWTGSMHLGVAAVLDRCALDDYLLVVNDDLVFDESFVQSLLDVSKKYPDAMIHARNSFLDKKDIIEFGGRVINFWTAKGCWSNKGRSSDEFPAGHVERSDVLWGRGLLVPMRIVKDVGNYDRRYQQSGDPEFSRRAAKAGYRLLVAYDVVAYMYPEKDANINVRRSYALSEFKDYFFGVLSQGRIKTLFLNSFQMTSNAFQGAVYFSCYLARHLWHFFRHVRQLSK